MKSEKEIMKDLVIDDSSLYSLEQQLKESARVEGDYIAAMADAEKSLERIKLKVEVCVAELVRDLKKEYRKKNGKDIPATGVSELRKSNIPLDRKYKKLREELIEAQYVHTQAENFLKSIISKGYRLQKIIEIHERQLREDNYTVSDKMREAGGNLKQND